MCRAKFQVLENYRTLSLPYKKMSTFTECLLETQHGGSQILVKAQTLYRDSPGEILAVTQASLMALGMLLYFSEHQVLSL